jgi:hypothetical protein
MKAFNIYQKDTLYTLETNIITIYRNKKLILIVVPQDLF